MSRRWAAAALASLVLASCKAPEDEQLDDQADKAAEAAEKAAKEAEDRLDNAPRPNN